MPKPTAQEIDARRADFQTWLSAMDFALDEMLAEAPPELAAKLDFSVSSLDALEAYLKSRFGGVEELKADPHWLDFAHRYFGEVLVRTTGRTWRLSTDARTMNFGKPVIDIKTPKLSTDVAPLVHVLQIFIDDTGTSLSRKATKWSRAG